MRRVLKNYSKNKVKTIFRGREVYFGPKQSQIFDMKNEEERAKYYFWKETYGFLGDITANVKEVNL